MSAMLAPWQQGALDPLCGLYAIINAIQYAAPDPGFSKSDASSLFSEIACELEDHLGVGGLLGYGLTRRSICVALQTASTWLGDNCDWKLEAKWPFYRSSIVEHSQLRRALRSHLLNSNTAAICALSGHIDHWTVVVDLTPDRAHLFDSCGMRFIQTSSLGPLGENEFRYQMASTQIALIRVTENT